MKIIWTIIRWILGVTFCLTSIGGFESGEIGSAFFILILGLLFLPPVTKSFWRSKNNSHASNNFYKKYNHEKNQQSFKSELKSFVYPDRIDSIVWHINAIEKGLNNGDLNFTNLSYAKFIESIRQQNINENGKFNSYLKLVKDEYKEFRNIYQLDYPEQFLSPSERKKTNKLIRQDNFMEAIGKNEENSTASFIDLNREEYLERLKDTKSDQEDPKRQKNIEDIAGFYGSSQYSDNAEYCVLYCDGYFNNDKWENGDIALIKQGKLLYKKKAERPNECYVSNNGLVVCCDSLNTNDLTGKFIIFNSNGETLFLKKTTANLGTCSISNDGKISIFETYNSNTEDSNKIFVIDINERNIHSKFERPIPFNNAIIDTVTKCIKLIDHRKFIFEIDFEGIQINAQEYEDQIMEKGFAYDKLQLYLTKSDELKFKDVKYLEILRAALNDKNASYSYGQDKIYKMIGEYYKAHGDIVQTIENWEKAIEINPKVGIKRELNALKKKE